MKKTVSAAFVALAVMPGGAHAEAHVRSIQGRRGNL